MKLYATNDISLKKKFTTNMKPYTTSEFISNDILFEKKKSHQKN